MKTVFKQCNPRNYKVGRTSPIKYIVIHYTANNGDTAKGNAEHYAKTACSASAHYFVDEYDTIYQSVKDVKVTEGTLVKQGDILATSGPNKLENEKENCLHFEVYKDGNLLNPESIYNIEIENIN